MSMQNRTAIDRDTADDALHDEDVDPNQAEVDAAWMRSAQDSDPDALEASAADEADEENPW
jgi:hypothetical protein